MKCHWLSLCLAALAGCAGDSTGTHSEVEQSNEISMHEQALFKDTGSTLNIVAHQDDDLGLMAPTLQHVIRSGVPVQTVYLTAGDAAFGCVSYWQGRLTGIKKAYERMANVSSGTWQEDVISVGGKSLLRLTLVGKPVTLILFGLPNPGQTAAKSLLKLWTTTDLGSPSATLSSVAGFTPANTFTREQLIETLRALIAQTNPQHINTLDSSRVWPEELPYEHWDHVGSALFALAAKQRLQANRTLRMHRAYNILFEADNMSAAQTSTRRDVFFTYAAYDRKICTTVVAEMCTGPGETSNVQPCDDPGIVYEPLMPRAYGIIPVQGVTGLLRRGTGTSPQCLKAAATSAGSAVSLAACAPSSATQKWELRKDGTVRQGSFCLSANVVAGQRPASGVSLTLQTCTANSATQQFMLTSEGKLRSPDASCVHAVGSGLSARECSGASAQLDWELQAPSAVFTGPTGFSDADVPDNSAYYTTLGLGDVSGDGRADLCVRRSAGIYCALANPTTPPSFAPPTLWSSDFRDSNGWSSASTGSTVQLAKVNGDSRFDVCGRRSDGIYCATSTGSSFTGFEKRSFGIDFSDSVLYHLYASVYGSLRFPDVNGDGRADVCARNAAGIECALNNGSTTGAFSAVSQWLTSEFSDALGWNDPDGGTTMRFADIDGDQKVDVCGRGAMGMHCALNTGASSFDNPHYWSHPNDWSNGDGWDAQKSYYGSIRLVDINGDGRADVCGRGYDGIVCGLSLGISFSAERPLIADFPYSDPGGWTPAKYGSTLTFGDIDADGRADLCARGPTPGGGVGIRCATGPAVAP